jgi:hypothetical protein
MCSVLAGMWTTSRWFGEWGEWAVAFSLSLVLNLLVILAFVGWIEVERQARPEVPEVVREVVALIHPESIRVEEIEPLAPVERPRGFARTSPQQASAPPERARYLGERDTRGASELEPVPGALEVPSQAGIEPRREGDLETTESRYQDGILEHDRVAQPGAAPSPAGNPVPQPTATANPAVQGDPALAAAGKPGDRERTSEAKTELPGEASPPEPPKLLEGPNPVVRPKPPEEVASEAPKERPPGRSEEGLRTPAAGLGDSAPSPPATRPPAVGSKDPGFRGFQRKTRLQGAISRRGVSALDVADSPLGRYHAELSRAVEREWQRNCVRYRDHIMPGWITLRFVVTDRGEARSISFVEAVEVGEIQKGFTLNSIRQADLPRMPDAVKRELDGEPLELFYNFYF